MKGNKWEPGGGALTPTTTDQENELPVVVLQACTNAPSTLQSVSMGALCFVLGAQGEVF